MIKFRKNHEGKYLGYFDTTDEAYEFVKLQASRYQRSGLHTNTIKDLCDEAQAKGIMLYPNQLSKWIKNEFRGTVKYTGNGKPKNKKTTTVTLDEELHERTAALSQVTSHGRSWWINVLLSVHAGIPVEPLIVFFRGHQNLDEYELTVTCLFYRKGKEIRALYMGDLDQSTRKLIESLCSDAEQFGMDFIENKCKRLGYFTLGNNNER